MRLLAELLLLPITGPVRALRFIAEQIQAEMEQAMVNEGQLETELINLSLRHDTGQITGAEYEAEEARLLEQLDAIRAYEVALMQEYQEAYDQEAWQEVDEQEVGQETDGLSDMDPGEHEAEA